MKKRSAALVSNVGVRRGWFPALISVALLAVLFSSTGCPRRLPEFGPSPMEEAEEVLAKVREKQKRPDAIIGDARVRIRGPAGRGSADHFIVVRRPDELRLETLSFFGNPMALIVVYAGSFLLWEIDAGEAWVGPATAESLAVLLPLDLEPEDVASLLLGTPRLFDVEKRLDLDHENRRYVVSLSDGRVWQQLMVHPVDFTIDEILWLEPSGEVRSRLRYDEHEVVTEDGKRFPNEIRYEHGDDVYLRVIYRDVEFEPEPDMVERLLEVTLPDDVRVFPLDRSVEPRPILPEDDDGAHNPK